jgi:hypothetical protein
MIKKLKKFKTVAATFSTALAIGFVVQNSDALASRFSPEEANAQWNAVDDLAMSNVAQPLDTLRGSDAQFGGIAAMTGQDAPMVPLLQSSEPVLLAAAEDVITPDTMTDATPSDETDTAMADMGSEQNCDMTMVAEPRDHAMVEIILTTPCYANEGFVIHHQGMMFSAQTSDEGVYKEIVPVLSEDAFFIAAFDNGEGAIADAYIPEIANYDRSVLQWQGDVGVHIHAREYGAEYGSTGHITAEEQRLGDLANLDDGQSGHLLRLGSEAMENALMAEIYTFPTANARDRGAIHLTVEAEVTETNCGREVAAQSLQLVPDATPTATDLTMKMPGCDTVGEFLVLNNMLEDLTLASR